MAGSGRNRKRKRRRTEIPVAAWTAAGALLLVAGVAPFAESAAESALSRALARIGPADALLSMELRLPEKAAEADAPGGEATSDVGGKVISVMDVDNTPAAGSDAAEQQAAPAQDGDTGGEGAPPLSGEEEKADLPGENGELEGQPLESWAAPEDILQMLSAKPISAITIAPASASGYVAESGIYIKNNTDYTVDIAASLKKPLAFALSGSGPQVLILHTHGSESYSEAGRDYYLKGENNRSTESTQNVTAVGDALAKVLTEKGIGVVHLDEMFDYPEYNGAYNRALTAIGEAMKENPSIKVVIDLHRDAMETETGVKYKTVTEVEGELAAQMMLVCGSDAGGLPHSGWAKNLRFAIRLQQRMNAAYPGLMRPISLREERFNQHVTEGGSLLIEMGTSGNTLEEALRSARLLGETLSALLLENKKN